jgi:thioredoxin reductase (NADPH)
LQNPYECIIVGAGPGGLQAAIYLARYNRKVLILDRGGGRTLHARHIENFLTHEKITGREIIERGKEQARSFGVHILNEKVISVSRSDHFETKTVEKTYHSKFVLVSSGVYDNLPSIENIPRFFGVSFFTCLDCDGYRTTGKKLAVIGNSDDTVRVAVAMKEMYTKEVTLLLYFHEPSQSIKEMIEEQGIELIKGKPSKLIGEDSLEGIVLKDGRTIRCEVILSSFGFKLNDQFLEALHLKKDGNNFRYVTNHNFESSLPGLYIVGPLNTGNDQVIIAAGEGAVAAIDINKRLLDM